MNFPKYGSPGKHYMWKNNITISNLIVYFNTFCYFSKPYTNSQSVFVNNETPTQKPKTNTHSTTCRRVLTYISISFTKSFMWKNKTKPQCNKRRYNADRRMNGYAHLRLSYKLINWCLNEKKT